MIYQILTRAIRVCVVLLRREASKAAAKAERVRDEQVVVRARTHQQVERIRHAGLLADHELELEHREAQDVHSKASKLARNLENINA